MSLLWAIPALAAVAGALVLILGLRTVDARAAELGESLRSLHAVRDEVRAVQDEAGRAAAVLERVRSARAGRRGAER